jgi:hypothetical protein
MVRSEHKGGVAGAEGTRAGGATGATGTTGAAEGAASTADTTGTAEGEESTAVATAMCRQRAEPGAKTTGNLATMSACKGVGPVRYLGATTPITMR